MFQYFVLTTLAVSISCQGHGKSQSSSQSERGPGGSRQLYLLSEKQQQYPSESPFTLLEPQFQQIPPGFNFISEKQPFPRVQPQIFLYQGAGGAAPGQPFLLQPGAPPPGNFLIPQPNQGPNVLFRGDVPRGPPFVAGYPKPAHIPPIEKDAEEIPTNPSRVPAFPSTPKRKPEKLETFDETDSGINREAGEAPGLAGSDRTPYVPSQIPNFKPELNNLRPGQRFFVLNGIPLFSNYPYAPNNPEYNLKYTHPNPLPVFPQLESKPGQPRPGFSQTKPSQTSHHLPLQNSLYRQSLPEESTITFGNHAAFDAKLAQQNIAALNQAENLKSEALLRSALPFGIDNKKGEQGNVQLRFDTKDFKLEPYKLYNQGFESGDLGNYFQYQSPSNQDDEAIIIEAARQDGRSSGVNGNLQATSIEGQSSQQQQQRQEPSMSQAHPGAIALAGPGGVASAGPRGTALVGAGGLAVSSPQATAVAGPHKDREQEAEEQTSQKPTRTEKSRKNKKQK